MNHSGQDGVTVCSSSGNMGEEKFSAVGGRLGGVRSVGPSRRWPPLAQNSNELEDRREQVFVSLAYAQVYGEVEQVNVSLLHVQVGGELGDRKEQVNVSLFRAQIDGQAGAESDCCQSVCPKYLS
jgi:hypothetical protein